MDFYKSKTYLFILEVFKPYEGVLKLTFYQEYYSDFPSVAYIYEYSYNDYSSNNWTNFDIADWDYLEGKTVIEFSYDPYRSTTTSLGFEITFDNDVKNVQIEGYKKYIKEEDFIYDNLIVHILVFILILVIFIIICCVCYYCCCKKPININVQNSVSRPLYNMDQNQPSPQYNQYNNNQYNNSQYNNNPQLIPPY